MGRVIFCACWLVLSVAPLAAEVSDETLLKAFRDPLKALESATCDIFIGKEAKPTDSNVQVGATWRNVTLHHRPIFYPNFKVTQRVLVHVTGHDANSFKPNASPKEFRSNTFHQHAYVTTEDFTPREFLQTCGIEEKCSCVLSGITSETSGNVAAEDQFAKFEVLVAQYVKDSLQEIVDNIQGANRDALFMALINTMENDAAATNRIIDILLKTLSDPKDEKVAKLISAKLMNDASIRKSFEQLIARLVRKSRSP